MIEISAHNVNIVFPLVCLYQYVHTRTHTQQLPFELFCANSCSTEGKWDIYTEAESLSMVLKMKVHKKRELGGRGKNSKNRVIPQEKNVPDVKKKKEKKNP